MNVRRDIDDAMFTKSRIDKEAPSRVTPNSDTVDPSRAKLLNARDDPITTKSSTDSEEPSCAIPNIDTELPKREKLRSDKVDPIWM